jgi:hypothetical protein
MTIHTYIVPIPSHIHTYTLYLPIRYNPHIDRYITNIIDLDILELDINGIYYYSRLLRVTTQ